MSRSLANITAFTCVLLKKVVERVRPANCTNAPITKFEPFTTSVNVELPTAALEGDKEVIEGTGLRLACAAFVKANKQKMATMRSMEYREVIFLMATPPS